MLAYKLEERGGLLILAPQKIRADLFRSADIHLQKTDKRKHISPTVNADKKCRYRQSYKFIKTRHAWLVCEMNGATKPLSAGTQPDFLQQ